MDKYFFGDFAKSHKEYVETLANVPDIDWFEDYDVARVKFRVEQHIQSAPEREAEKLKEWARGYDDGIRTALAILSRESL